MKKIYLTLATGVVALSAAAQQQLPNAGFEDSWADCAPWTSKGNEKTFEAKNLAGDKIKAQTPGDWTISHVIGIDGMGATLVGEKSEGYNSGSSIKIYNAPNSILPQQIVPGYFTLGTTWSTSKLGNSNDGGTFGGIQFTGRPESISFMYKRTHDTEYDKDASEPATVVAYIWAQTFTQADVPGNITMDFVGDTRTKVNMVNRDRNILGMETALGGVVTEKGTLIAKIDYQIKGDAEDWTELTIPFEYVDGTENITPEMINVIFAAGDYWSTTPLRGNTLNIDDVKLNYPVVEQTTTDYKGKLVIIMDGSTVNPGDETGYTVSITDIDDNTCNLKLANFVLESFGGLRLGDINVDGVKKTTEADGTVKYEGKAENLVLHGTDETGEPMLDLNVDIVCTGTCKGKVLNMIITVNWNDGSTVHPIEVTFNGTQTSGVEIIDNDDENAPVEYYNLNGQRIANPTGLVIRRQGSKVTKVIIK